MNENKDPIILIDKNSDIKKLYKKIKEKHKNYEMSSLSYVFEGAIRIYGKKEPCIRIGGYYSQELKRFHFGYKDWYIENGYSVYTLDEFVGETAVKDERWAELI